MALMQSKMVSLGTPALNFSLPGTEGKLWTLDAFSDKKALVIIFMCNHCPYVKAVLDRLISIQKDYAGKGVQLVGINPNDDEAYPEDSMEKMKELVMERNIPFPYLRDDSQQVARRYNAVCTPDIYVYGPERKLIYRGRIDDNWQDESKVTRNDLRDALDVILEGKLVSPEQTPSMGCSIKWR